MRGQTTWMTAVLAAAAALAAGEAAAHHPMGGEMPTTFVEGFLSGLGHPVLGLDHLAAVIAAGCIAATLRQGLALAVVYILVMLAGAALHAAGISLPGGEILAAAAVIALGAALIWRHGLSFTAGAVLFTVAGLIHGNVLGETIVGAEPAPIVAYFAGLAIVQTAIIVGTLLLARSIVAPALTTPLPLRAAGALTVVIGVWFLAANVAAA